VDAIIRGAFDRARDAARGASQGAPLTEASLQKWILDRFAEEGLVTSDSPTVALDAHSGDPHFSNSPSTDAPIRAGSLLLVDAWAKASRPGAVYADYTQMGFLGATVPDRFRDAFQAVRDARDAAIAAVRGALAARASIRGCDVDDAARGVIASRGLAARFVHRTGHSIGEEVHANGVHLDNLETRDERLLLDGTLVSVEPGVYFDDFGVRSEVNLLVDSGEVRVTTEPIQRELPALLA
jgi:Xaa-Pro dipeptidase